MKTPTQNERVLALLSDGREHTSHELYALHVIAHSRVAELRARGHQITCWRDGDQYVYQLDPSVRLTEPLSNPGRDRDLIPPALLAHQPVRDGGGFVGLRGAAKAGVPMPPPGTPADHQLSLLGATA